MVRFELQNLFLSRPASRYNQLTMETNGQFYLGRLFNRLDNQVTREPLLYDPADLTTHGVVLGMTGSGKTGLCLGLLEEAALNHIPAIMIDPKGDITNALLHFPALAPADFEPWIGPDAARRAGKTSAEIAAETAERWRAGLAEWNITSERIQQLADSVQFAVYTPGSDAGLPVSVLASLQAPDLDWQENKEAIREKISSTVTAILGLIGEKDIDPLRSQEHILLANIFETAWSTGRDLDLGDLIQQVQDPPFDRLGVFALDQFYPPKKRFNLAMSLNNILASPSFQSWGVGEPLDAARLLFTVDGRPRHSIFYIAHLSKEEQMFFVTLLLSTVESWMRTQRGTTHLRALLYFDELFGYLPPIAQPSSKPILLRLLKQARAFGLGLLLATQNPVDVDYKALSNAGTWFIGKLATEQDKDRLLDGLSSAAPEALDRRTYDDLISALGKRVFLLRNVHTSRPVLFQTRWAMNYLAGPLTRAQIGALNALAGSTAVTEMAASPPGDTNSGPSLSSAKTDPVEPKVQVESRPQTQGMEPTIVSIARPVPASTGKKEAQLPAFRPPGIPQRDKVPAGVGEYFLPMRITPEQALLKSRMDPVDDAQVVGLVYRPALLAQAKLVFYERKYDLNIERKWAALVQDLQGREQVDWEHVAAGVLSVHALDRKPYSEATFLPLTGGLENGRVLRGLRQQYIDWLYRHGQVVLRVNEKLGVVARPDEPEEVFQARCQTAAQEMAAPERDRLMSRYASSLEKLQEKVNRAATDLADKEQAYSRQRNEEALAHAKMVAGLFSRKRRTTSQKERQETQKRKDALEKAQAQFEAAQADLDQFKREQAAALAEIEQRWAVEAGRVTEQIVRPYKKNIQLELFGVAWLPYHAVISPEDNQPRWLPAFE